MTIILPKNPPSGLLTRRRALLGLAASFLAAPAIVRADSIMPVRRVLITGRVRPKRSIDEFAMCLSLAGDVLRGEVRTEFNGWRPTMIEARQVVRYALENDVLGVRMPTKPGCWIRFMNPGPNPLAFAGVWSDGWRRGDVEPEQPATWRHLTSEELAEKP